MNIEKQVEAWSPKLMELAHKAEADTPEDAACKLAIELFKQGVLKHD